MKAAWFEEFGGPLTVSRVDDPAVETDGAITSTNSVLCLRKRGHHIQIGLLAGDDHRPRFPMEHVIGKELEIVGSHGMQAHRYADMLELISIGRLEPQRLIGKTIPLEEAPQELTGMSDYGAVGITVIDGF